MIAVDGKCLRGAWRPDGSRVFLLSAVRHGDGITLVWREIGATTKEIPESGAVSGAAAGDQRLHAEPRTRRGYLSCS
ncbi:transposase IS4 family protein [Streptomyces hygroscopicus]|nr:transposase IS4 family protein [Streptomyces hygroscopicus]